MKNQDNFGVWQLSDPNMKTTSEGEDGTLGFKYSWESEKLGKGAQEIVNIVDGERMDTHMYFYDFDDTPSDAYFTVEAQGDDQTLVKWGISWTTPYPWNLMSLFYNMDKDFNEGLGKLKEILESQESFDKDLSYANNYFKDTFQNLKDKISGLTSEQLHFKASENSWSISQCLEHITLTENMIFGMIQESMKSPTNPEDREKIQHSDQDILNFSADRTEKYKAPEMLLPEGKYGSPEDALNELNKQRESVYTFIKNTPIEELRNRVSESPSGHSDVYQSLLFMAGHTARHTLQIEEIKSATNFPN